MSSVPFLPESRPIRIECQEDHGLIQFQSLAKKFACQGQIMSLAVKLPIRIEQRSDPIQIGDCRTPHKNILLFYRC